MRAQDLHRLLEQLDARRPVLIGWSQGVQDLAAYIERYGTHDLAGLVLVDATVAMARMASPRERRKARRNCGCSHSIKRISRNICVG